ncbi:carboxypeptidase regulatory-like domain-containing protein [Halorussus halophilus]|uniref:carboxypeptidase regulatory-like domain-containing protein n=1 Tax=Halorussus halophilus TaxID=2650975 RepID=UPI001301430E|nr:carboxypeptidase regulatory-like domain-containing protein [Halorussus halophilus]
MLRKTTLVLGLVLASIAFATVVGATTTVNGTVTVENGTADGANVTVTPMTQGFKKMDDPVRTTVDGKQFSADVPDAPLYLVEVVHDGAVHSEVLRNETAVSMRLNRSLSGTVVNETGEPRTNATVQLVSGTGYSVDRTKVGQSGTFEFGPLQSNQSYRIQVVADGVPYLRTINTSETSTVTIETPPPTDDKSVLNVSGGNPANHVLQVLAPQNASQSPTVVETLTLRNTGDRPYVGTVTVVTPNGSKPYSAMFQGRQTSYRQTSRGVEINVTVPANSSARIGVAYDINGRTFKKTFGHNSTTVAVVLRGYEPKKVNHSANLEVGDSPIPLLTNTEPITNGDTVRLELTAPNTSGSGTNDAEQASAESNSMPTFPAIPLLGGLVAIVGGGFVAYRVL